MKFEAYNISPEIKKNLELLGFKKPTDIQFKAIPSILKGEDVLAIAQTGTGKTAAFAIPVIHYLQNFKVLRDKNSIRCLVMEPTHELAMQINEVFQQIGRGTGVKTACIYGGVDQLPQIERLEKGLDVLIATPGRMFDLVSQGHIKLNNLEVLILDEADHMLDLGFIHDIRQLTRIIPQKRQTLFFSATIGAEIKELAYSLVKKAVRIQLSPQDPVSKNVEHAVAFVEMDDKRFFLERIIKEHPESKILVFVRTKVRAERVYKAMERVNISTQTIHGDKDQKERSQTLNNFRQGINKILIATDVSARGIDIPDVDYVINYDLPDEAENYVHRVGRTGRGTKKGQALSFCSTEEKAVLNEIQEFLQKPITVLEVAKAFYEETIDISNESDHNWKKLIDEAKQFNEKKAKRKNKR
ncbi:MAG: DEAD/DEAH box helicase [Bacteroidetes bacterium]|nr:DEAD/DEAH box helicase [Bacteroidota bacterium]